MQTQLKDQLAQMRLLLQERIRRVESDLRRAGAPLSNDAPDRAAELENDEVLERIGATSKEELERVDAALARLASGWNLTCESCGEPISSERLAAVPYANRCAACATHP